MGVLGTFRTLNSGNFSNFKYLGTFRTLNSGNFFGTLNSGRFLRPKHCALSQPLRIVRGQTQLPKFFKPKIPFLKLFYNAIRILVIFDYKVSHQTELDPLSNTWWKINKIWCRFAQMTETLAITQPKRAHSVIHIGNKLHFVLPFIKFWTTEV